MMASASSPTAVTAQNVARQPKCLAQPGAERHAQHVGDGQAGEHDGDGRRALVRGTRPVATTEPTPKNVPWAKAVSTRAAISRP
jgi:hypothetical protein